MPNIILTPSDKKDYTFRSFWDREDCFRILTAFLNKFRGLTYEQPAPSKTRPPRDRSSMGVAPSSASAPGSIEAAGVAAESGDGSPTAASESIKAKHMSLPLPRKNATAAVVASGNSPTTGTTSGAAATPTSTVSDSMDGEFESGA